MTDAHPDPNLQIAPLASESTRRIAHPAVSRWKQRGLRTLPSIPDVATALLTTGLVTSVAWSIEPFISESDIIMLYVAAVTLTAFRVRLGMGVVSAVLNALMFNFFFTEPRRTLYVHDSRYWLTFVMMGTVGILVATLAARLRERAHAVMEREAQNQALFQLTRQLAGCLTTTEVAERAVDQIHRLFGVPACVFLSANGALASGPMRDDMPNDEVEHAAARWAALQGVPAGAGTASFGAARGWYVPLGNEGHTGGVIGIVPTSASRLDEPSPRRLFETVRTLISEFMERRDLEALAQASQLQAETEQIRSTLLSSVSHDLRTPLATITGAVTTLLDDRAQLADRTRVELLEQVANEALRLQRTLENVLRMTRLDGRKIAPSLDWEMPHEIVIAAVERAAAVARSRRVITRCAGEPALARLDAVLVEQLVANYVENALLHTGGDSPVEVSTTVSGDEVVVEVADRGPGLPVDHERLWGKFVRGPDVTAGGAGLGLAICKAIAQVHGGRVWSVPREGGGAVFGAAFPRGGPDGESVPKFEEVLDQAGNT